MKKAVASCLLVIWVGACSGSGVGAEPPAAPDETNATEAAPTKKAEPAPAPAPAEEGGTPEEATGAVTEDEGPEACPEGMVLVEGDYCTLSDDDEAAGAKDQNAVEHECIKEWYAPQNKKRVCEEFAPKAKCLGKKIKKRYCIDKYSWPNKKGERPEVMNRFYQAQVKCAAVGKRMCTESEWTFACEGPDMKPFPYGFKRDADKCHGDEEWDSPNMTKVAQRDPDELRRLYKGVPSGSQPECVSDFGVYDLPGNNDEVVASETFESGWRGKYESIHTGGPWYKGVRNQCRPKIYTHDEGFYYYFLGFRCCAEPDGAETDPRTPHQIKKDWAFERVERLAGATTEEVQKLLEKKEKDGDCGCKDTRCHTLCGTLLERGLPKESPSETPDSRKTDGSGSDSKK